VHLVARRAKKGEIVWGVVLPIAVKVGDFQNLNDAKTAMHAINAVVIMLQSQLAILDALGSHSIYGFFGVACDAFTML
jgi:hypothetical protein